MELLAPSKIQLDSEQGRHVLGKALQRLQESWGFSNAEMAGLLRQKPNTYGYWMRDETVKASANSTEVELIVALFSIFRSLGAMFVSPADQVLWLKAPHPDFAGQSPLEFAKRSSENLFHLKQYLEYIRGRGA